MKAPNPPSIASGHPDILRQEELHMKEVFLSNRLEVTDLGLGN